MHHHVTHRHVTHIKATGQEVGGICLQEKFVQRQETCHLVCVHCRPVGHQRGQANKEVLKAWGPLEGRIIVGRKAVAVDLVVHRHMLSDSSTRHSLRGFLSQHHKTTVNVLVFSHHLTEQSIHRAEFCFLEQLVVFSLWRQWRKGRLHHRNGECEEKERLHHENGECEGEASPQKWRMWRKGEASPWKWRIRRKGKASHRNGECEEKERLHHENGEWEEKARLHHRNGECEEKERLHHKNGYYEVKERLHHENEE